MNRFTIDELAARTGMTVRNIRAFQSRHLLPAPVWQGRSNLYDESHVERIELVRRLQDEGFTLESVRTLIERGEEFTAEVARLREGLAPADVDGDPEWIPMTEQALRIAVRDSAQSVERLVQTGVLRLDEEGQLWVRPDFGVRWRLLELGLGPDELADLVELVERRARSLGRALAGHLSGLPGSPAPGELAGLAARLTTEALTPALREELDRAPRQRATRGVTRPAGRGSED
ncbi:MAG TPA: MerR family transcriptional regulator [Actinomycetes bacterium]|nr:MerR family transcriptional regulator [Actinomycetes bacterium]